MTLIPDLKQAQSMIDALAPNGSMVTYQTFDDNADRKKQGSLIRQFHGDILPHADELERLNKGGAGVFIAVNETDGKGRTASNITAVRALFVDFDTADAERIGRLVSPPIVPPSLIVESSPDKHHAYWITEGIPLDKFKQHQQTLIAYFASIGDEPDKAVHDLPRVMRLAGYYHQKVKADKGQNGEPFLTRVAYVGKRYQFSSIEKWLTAISKDLPAQLSIEPAKKSKQQAQQASTLILPQATNDSELPQLDTEQVRALARGRWQAILSKLGYSVSSNSKEHTQCPVCGGSDRFRFDDEHGNGSYVCSQGTGETVAGDGLSLLIDHAGMSIADAVRAVTSALNSMGLISPHDDKTKPSSNVWGEPESLTTDSSKSTPYPINAWNEPIRSVIKKIEYYSQAHIAMVGQTTLGALAHLGQRFVDSPMEKKHNPTSLIIITEGGSGSGKTQTMDLVFKEIFEYEKGKYDEYIDQYSIYKDSRTDDVEKLEPPNPQTVFKNATIEPILDKFVNGQMVNASWATDDGAQFFNGHTMTGQTAGSALADLTDLYSGGTVDRTRSLKNNHGNPRTKAYNVRMTLMLMAQRVILKKALTNELLNKQGFLPRALISCPDSLQGKRVYNDPARRKQDPYTDPVLIDFWDRCKELLSPLAVSDYRTLLNQADGERKKMQWHDEQTEQFFADKRQEVENRQAKGGDLEYFPESASRMAENASRIATLMAHFDKQSTITTDYIDRAFKLVNYSMSEFLRYQSANPTGEQNRSEKLSSWLVEKSKGKQPPMLTRTYISNSAPSPFRDSIKILQEELDKLESAEHIKQELGGSTGRQKLVYINPKLFT